MKKTIGAALAAFIFVFQVMLITRSRLLYAVLQAAFFGLVLFLLAALVRTLPRRRLLLALVLLTVAVRVPFYLHPEGLLTTGDNAVDALQPVEMRADRAAPFFIHEAVKHIGTIKPLWVAFIWDVTGNHYLWYLLVQLAFFIGLLFVLNDLWARAPGNASLSLLLVLGFLFIEVLFDYSLSIRGGPYLEMVLFIGLGAALFDFEFRDKLRWLLAYQLLFFSIYIHPLAAVLAGSFLVCAVVQSVLRKRFWMNLGFLAAGAFLGLFHWFYYLAFAVKPVSTGSWEEIGLRPLALMGGRYPLVFLKNVKTTFVNLFSFEYSYLADLHLPESARRVLGALNQAAVLVSLAVLLAAVVLAVRALVRFLRRKDAPEARHLLFLFYLLLLAGVLVKIFLFYPPHTEPRHNMDLAVAVMMAYLFVIPVLVRPRALRRWAVGIGAAAALAMTVPHYATFYLNAAAKQRSYAELMAALRTAGVRYVDTDYTIAQPINFLSGRTILAGDGLGPSTVNVFYNDQRARIDGLPADRKAYIFFSEAYRAHPRYKTAVRVVHGKVLERLNAAGIAYRTVRLKDYDLVIPEAASGGQRPDR